MFTRLQLGGHSDYQSRDKHNEIHLQEIQAGSIMLNDLRSHQNARLKNAIQTRIQKNDDDDEAELLNQRSIQVSALAASAQQQQNNEPIDDVPLKEIKQLQLGGHPDYQSRDKHNEIHRQEKNDDDDKAELLNQQPIQVSALAASAQQQQNNEPIDDVPLKEIKQFYIRFEERF
ncbi:unnamed protein product [Rotaria sp. Silwood1]|nr:unnamed protein product [Rotaria sp. Silwood1]